MPHPGLSQDVGEAVAMSGRQPMRTYDIHGALSVRTNVRLSPSIPSYLEAEVSDPGLVVEWMDRLETPSEDRVVSAIGHPPTRDLGDGDVFYEVPLPLLHYLGVRGSWPFLLRGLLRDRTEILTATPFFHPRPIESRVADLLSRVAYLVLSLKLLRKGIVLGHAAAVAREDDVFLFFGYVGSGKTTIVLDLLDSVCDGYLSDDYALMRRDGEVLAWPEYHPPHSEDAGMPGLRYMRGRYRETSQASFPIRKAGRVRAVYFLERGPEAIVPISRSEAARRAALVNIDELSRFWNSPGAQLVGQYAYFYPELDVGAFMAEYAACLTGFLGAADAFILRSPSRYENARGALERLGGRT